MLRSDRVAISAPWLFCKAWVPDAWTHPTAQGRQASPLLVTLLLGVSTWLQQRQGLQPWPPLPLLLRLLLIPTLARPLGHVGIEWELPILSWAPVLLSSALCLVSCLLFQAPHQPPDCTAHQQCVRTRRAFHGHRKPVV